MGKNNLSITALNGEFQRFSQIATAPTDTTNFMNTTHIKNNNNNM